MVVSIKVIGSWDRGCSSVVKYLYAMHKVGLNLHPAGCGQWSGSPEVYTDLPAALQEADAEVTCYWSTELSGHLFLKN